MTPEPSWMEYSDRLGFPLALLLGIFYVVKRLCVWAKPHVERILDAHVSRQEKTATALESLAEKTAAIQGSNANTLAAIEKKMPEVCRWNQQHEKN